MQRFRKLDIFPKFDSKFEQDAREKTAIGAILSLVAAVLVVFLLISEISYYRTSVERHELYVDDAVGGDLPITINVSFPGIPCDLITIDAVDNFGEFQEHMDSKTIKHRIDKDFKWLSGARPMKDGKKVKTTPVDGDGAPKVGCGSCYGAELQPGECCNTCDEVQLSYTRRGWHFDLDDVSVVQCAAERLEQAAQLSSHEGCNVFAHFSVSRVQGNIHFIPGRSFQMFGEHLHDVQGAKVQQLDLSHVVHTLQFGQHFPGQENPLDGYRNILDLKTHTADVGNGKFNYFLKIVPTKYEKNGKSFETNQYSVTQHYAPRPANGNPLSGFIPGVFIVYDLSPIRVRIYEQFPYSSLVHFLLQLCAICGGVVTVAGIVDALLHHSVLKVRRKMQLGKQM